MMIVPDRDVVFRPFILLGYVEICAMFFSAIGIVFGIVGLILYHPFLWISEKLLRRPSGRVSNRYTYTDVPSPVHSSHDEDGTPD